MAESSGARGLGAAWPPGVNVIQAAVRWARVAVRGQRTAGRGARRGRSAAAA